MRAGTWLAPRVPPPIFWTQNPCFLEVTDRVALQNIENNEVPCKIVQDKELRAISASADSFRLEGGAKRTFRDDLMESFWDHCATKWGNNLQGLAVQAMTCDAARGSLFARMGFVVSHPSQSTRRMGSYS
jgi:hypothetical protein